MHVLLALSAAIYLCIPHRDRSCLGAVSLKILLTPRGFAENFPLFKKVLQSFICFLSESADIL